MIKYLVILTTISCALNSQANICVNTLTTESRTPKGRPLTPMEIYHQPFKTWEISPLTIEEESDSMF